MEKKGRCTHVCRTQEKEKASSYKRAISPSLTSSARTVAGLCQKQKHADLEPEKKKKGPGGESAREKILSLISANRKVRGQKSKTESKWPATKNAKKRA